MFAFIKTSNSLVISSQGKRWTLLKDNPNWQKTIDSLKAKDWDKVISILEPAKRIIAWSNSIFNVDTNGQLCIGKDQDIVNDVVAKKIIEFYKEELPFEPIINFWNRLKSNPSKNSVEQLYRFLEHNHLPITEDGMLIAYKGVNHGKVSGEYESSSAGKDGKKVLNKIGTIVTIDRGEVIDNPNVACDTGLHVGSYEYAKGFASVLLEVLVDPADVVSVPHDCSSQKMRVCSYQILGLMETTKYTENLKADIKKDTTLPKVDAQVVITKLTAKEIQSRAISHIGSTNMSLRNKIASYDTSNKKGLIALISKAGIKVKDLETLSSVGKVQKFIPNYSLTSREMLKECKGRMPINNAYYMKVSNMISKDKIDRTEAVKLIKLVYESL